MPRVNGFFHAGITVEDMDTSLRFYRDGIRRLWPRQPVRVLLLFTAGARACDCTEMLGD